MGIEITIKGINLEYDNKLALRKFGTPGRKPEECLPWRLEVGRNYEAIKSGQIILSRDRDIPLVEIRGNQQFSDSIAMVRITSVEYYTEKEEKSKIRYGITEIVDRGYSQKNERSLRGVDRWES